LPQPPPIGLKILWLEINLKILSSGHKKPQPNYALEELLTSKLREENPFYLVKGQPAVCCSFCGVLLFSMPTAVANDLISVLCY